MLGLEPDDPHTERDRRMDSPLTLDRLKRLSPAQAELALSKAKHVEKLHLLRALYMGDGADAVDGAERVRIVAQLGANTFLEPQWLQQIANLTGRRTRLEPYPEHSLRNDGKLGYEPYALEQIALNLTARADALFGSAEAAQKAVAALPDAVAGRLAALLVLGARDGGAQEAAARLLFGRPLSDRFLVNYLDQIEKQAARDVTETLTDYTGLSGAALLAQVEDDKLAKLSLAAFAAGQAMVTQLRRPPVAEVDAARRRLYAAPELPAAFWARMEEGFANLQAGLLVKAGPAATPYFEAPGRWPDLSVAEQRGFLQSLANDMADAFRVPRPHIVISGSPEDKNEPLGDDGTLGVTHFASEAPWRADVQLNFGKETALRRSFGEAVGTLIHEFQHVWQGFVAFGPDAGEHMMLPAKVLNQVPAPALQDAVSLQFRQVILGNVGMQDGCVYDSTDSGKPEDDAAYRAQPVEKMAFAFEQRCTPLVMTTLSLMLHARAPGYLLALAQNRLENLSLLTAEEARVEGAEPKLPAAMQARLDDLLPRLAEAARPAVTLFPLQARQLLQEAASLLQDSLPHLKTAIATLTPALSAAMGENLGAEVDKTQQLLRLIADAEAHRAAEERQARLGNTSRRLQRGLHPAPRLPAPIRR